MSEHGKKRKAGPEPKPESEKESEVGLVYMTKATKLEILRKADAKNMKFSAFMKKCALEAAE